MKRACRTLATCLPLALLLAGVTAACADAPSEDPAAHGWILFEPDDVAWQPAPPSLLPGAKVAVLEGDPSKEGFFTMRLFLPDGYRVLPHWHTKEERVTVLSGTLHLGHGDTFDPAQAKPLPAGSYSSMPPNMTHFGWASGDTVLQLSTIGPWQIVYLNPEDDPRRATKAD
ncbi:MAG TPA: cupin domain-containing protein [Candidatus Binatia bacterium]